MHSKSSLSGAHLRAYEKIFQHPLSHSLTWREVHGLFAHVGQAVEEPNVQLTVTRNDQTVVLHPSAGKDVDVDELMKIRHFLERTEAAPNTAQTPETHLLLVINHHEARLYRTEMHGATPERILPPAPEDFFRHAHHSKDFTRGEEKPDPNTFFEPIAQALKSGGRILIFGSGTGMSSEMEQFVAWVRARHPDLAGRIAGTRVIDEHHLSEGELLAQARKAYASL